MRRTAPVRPRRGSARALAPVAVAALVAVLAVGCSDDGDPDSDATDDERKAPMGALTEAQIAEAVLQEENLGEGWTSEPSDDDEDDQAPGCLGDIEGLTDGLPEKARGGTEFTYGEQERPLIESTISAYADQAAITALFDQVQVALTGCTTISDTDDDGVTWDLALTSDEEVSLEVDDQSNVSATGTLTTEQGETVDIYIEWTNVRVGHNIGSITTFDVEPRTAEHDTWAQIAVDRLNAVIAGEEPETTTAPAPA